VNNFDFVATTRWKFAAALVVQNQT